jgi:small-conductance mechanosensitive channel
VLRIVWRLITFAEQWFTEHAVEAERDQELTPVIKLLVILSRVFGLTIGLAILLSHFGVDVTLLAATVGIVGLAVSLGARSLFADLVAGITILLDRPFRVGDRIEIEAKETWGDVIDIGLRSTRIRTPDNRVVIVPNSNIAQNEVVNYSYPDPVYRYQTHVGVAYGTDIEAARRVIIEAMQQLEEVLPDRPVDALYVEMGDSSIVFRVRWWMGSYVDTRHILDRVHTSIHAAFDAAGIQIPFPQRDLHLDIVPETAGQITKAIKDSKQPGSNGQANEQSNDS